jgi:hypothetical protein
VATHLRAGSRYVVARFHAFFGGTLRRGQRLELTTIAAHNGDRYFYTEFHFRDVDTGEARLWVIDGAQDDDTGRDLFEADGAEDLGRMGAD